MRIFSILVISLIVLACCSNLRSSHKESNASLPISIELSDCFTSSKNVFKLSEIAESISYVKLETTNASLLSGIIYISPFENGYLIVDLEESIFLFDKEGKFKWKINNKGRGPTEYVELSVPLGIDTATKEIIVPDNRNLALNPDPLSCLPESSCTRTNEWLRASFVPRHCTNALYRVSAPGQICNLTQSCTAITPAPK